MQSSDDSRGIRFRTTGGERAGRPLEPEPAADFADEVRLDLDCR